MMGHHRMAVQSVDLMLVDPEVLTESGVPAELRLGGQHRHRPVPGKTCDQQFDGAADIADGRRGIERRTHLVQHNIEVQMRQRIQPGADTGLQRRAGLRPQRARDPHHIRRAGDLVRIEHQHRRHAVRMCLGHHVAGTGEVIGQEPERRHEVALKLDRARRSAESPC